MSEVSRKDFIATIGTVGATAAIPAAAIAEEQEVAATKPQPSHHAHPVHAPSPSQKPLALTVQGYSFFNGTESAFVETAVERLIPSDAHGPGAREAGVAYFIDQQLVSDFGFAAKMYMQGPWPEAETTQGYQLPLTPREVYHIGIIRTNEYVQKKYGKTFESISSTAHQDEILQALESGEAGFEDFSSKVFFEMLLANTIEGYFGDPMYGGNRNKVGWRLVGFPGAAAAYVGLVAKHNVPYSVTPMGIGDLQQQEAAMGPETQADADHMARMHIMLGRRALGLEK